MMPMGMKLMQFKALDRNENRKKSSQATRDLTEILLDSLQRWQKREKTQASFPFDNSGHKQIT